MSKTFIYGITASFIAITASATFFFPVVSNINSFLNDRVRNYSITSKNSKNVNEMKPSNGGVINLSHIENPRVRIYNDSFAAPVDEISEVNPLKTEMLQGEVPTNKSF